MLTHRKYGRPNSRGPRARDTFFSFTAPTRSRGREPCSHAIQPPTLSIQCQRTIYIGAVAEDSSGYPDCRPEFYEAFQQAIDAGTKPETRVEIVTPVIHLSKSEIVRRGLELGAPLELTWSCYISEDRACGRCDSCALRLRAFQEAGAPDPISYA